MFYKHTENMNLYVLKNFIISALINSDLFTFEYTIY